VPGSEDKEATLAQDVGVDRRSARLVWSSSVPRHQPQLPRWNDVDYWRSAFAAAKGAVARRAAICRQVEAAGGRVEGNTVLLPAGLESCLALSELRMHAVGLKLEWIEGAIITDTCSTVTNFSPETLARMAAQCSPNVPAPR